MLSYEANQLRYENIIIINKYNPTYLIKWARRFNYNSIVIDVRGMAVGIEL